MCDLTSSLLQLQHYDKELRGVKIISMLFISQTLHAVAPQSRYVLQWEVGFFPVAAAA